MVTRRRRIIDDDEDENDGNSDDGERQQDTQIEDEEPKVAASNMIDRLKRRAAKSKEVAQQKIKRKKLRTEDNDNNRTSDKSTSAKKEQSIPKKPKKTQLIPKKSSDDKTGTNNEEGKVKKETPSLLSEMKKPQIPKANISKTPSGGARGNFNSTKNKTRPFNSSWGTTHSSNALPKRAAQSPLRLSPANAASTPPPATSSLADFSGQPEPTSIGVKNGEDDKDKFGSGVRKLVWDGLRDLCKDSFERPPERNGVDLFASFLRHRDLKATVQTSSNVVDSGNNLRYDFFDTDEATGTIVLQPKIPIFPEDFPAGGRSEWPLSWWGIVEPSIEEKTHDDKDTETHTKSRRNRSGVRIDGEKDNSRDRIRRENSHNTRKRPQRDRYEDEHPHYDGYPSWDDNRDRFPHGEYHDGKGGYPPPLNGTEYDHNKSVSGYPPNYRLSHHRGGSPSFPNRMRDSHDADYRGGRPYPAHGNGPASREYPHRDPYGPQGRGPPRPRDGRRENRDRSHYSPPRDDRRENRDRLQRSPHSKSDRDDVRHAPRNAGSSIRKDRTHSPR